MTVLRDDRGASTAVTHALAVGISSLLILTLLFGLGGFLDGQEKNAADRQVRAIGERVGTELSKAVRTSVGDPATPGDDNTVRVAVSHPERVAGESYRITLEQTDCKPAAGLDDGCVEVVTQSDTSARIPVEFAFAQDVVIDGTTQTVDGGNFEIVVTPDGSGKFEVTLEES